MPHPFQRHAHTLESGAKVGLIVPGVGTILPSAPHMAPPVPVLRRSFKVMLMRMVLVRMMSMEVVLVRMPLATPPFEPLTPVVAALTYLSDKPDPRRAVAPALVSMRAVLVRPFMPSV
jgi:hypothetical protein